VNPGLAYINQQNHLAFRGCVRTGRETADPSTARPTASRGAAGQVGFARDDKGKARFSGKVVADDKAFFKSNLDRFEVKIAEDVSPG
jgi:hypothetical protein